MMRQGKFKVKVTTKRQDQTSFDEFRRVQTSLFFPTNEHAQLYQPLHEPQSSKF